MANIWKTVLVTGANGMLATNLIESLSRSGYHVVGTLRRGRQYYGAKNDRVELVEADFKDPSSLSGILARCNAVIHVAAMTSQSCGNYDVYRRVNVEATENLLKEAVKCGVEDFVFVSTANTIGYGGGEARQMFYPFTESLYARSKKEAEMRVLQYSDKIRIVIVNPTFMIGKYSSSDGSGRVFDIVKRFPIVFCPVGGKNVINVEDAAEGIVAAMERGRNGENYLICGKNYSYKELFERVAASLGLKRLFVEIPPFMLELFGCVGDLLRRLGVDTEMSRVNMDILAINNFYFSRKACSELGFNPSRDIV